MTRKDFELIARTIASLSPKARKEAARTFAGVLNVTNPRFDAARFIEACEPPMPLYPAGHPRVRGNS